jgi:hypothetical protein
MAKPEQSEQKGLRRLREAGADLAGAMTGAGVGLIAGPPGAFVGAAAGVAVGHVLRAIGEEIGERALSPRQSERVGAVWILAGEEIAERLAAGETPRGDGFFEERTGRRSSAEELLEGLLLQAGDAYEERKLAYLAHLYASLCFRADFNPEYANYLLKVADDLTYRQICLISLFGNPRYKERLSRLDEEFEKRRTGGARGPLVRTGVIAELDQLGNRSILGFTQNSGEVAHFAAVIEGGTFAGGHYARNGLMDIGRALFELMCLQGVPNDQIQEVLRDLGET